MLKLILPFFLWNYFAGKIAAECVHSGDLYNNGSSWKPDACTFCICEDPIAVCHTKRCTIPTCDPKQGMQLVILAGSCCPVCRDMQDSCIQDGKLFENDAKWNVTSCMACHCKWGRMSCTSKNCPMIHCQPGETFDQLPGECCPKCMQTRHSCLHNGIYHSDGSSWNPIPCTNCVCQHGQVKCYPVQCPSLVCQKDQIELSEGECCPKCMASTCQDGRHTFKDGDSWHRSPCEVCSCIGDEILCVQQQCNDTLPCINGQISWTVPGKCCPECLNPSGLCEQVSPARLNQEVWRKKGCEYCQCDRGQVQCQDALCQDISCPQPYIKVHKKDQCCPECILPEQCEFSDRTYKSGEVWYPDNCSTCSCNNGDVSCYQESCTVCPANAYRVPTELSCCGYCQTYECSPECTECIPDQPSVCTKCFNPLQFVLDGKCLEKCPRGYYGSPGKLCKKCDASCLSCSKGGPYYCSECKSGLLYLEGQCVSQCPEGYNLQNWRCQSCHSSCRTCIGPAMEQCLSCSLPGQMVYKGRCVDHCPPSMFVQSNHCVDCPQGCLKCSGTSQKCLICADDAILHNGHCMLNCPDGFYTHPDGTHCMACHPSCLKCAGGRDDNCLSCHRGTELRDGKCHTSCFPGEYQTYDGHCKACRDGCKLCHVHPNGNASICYRCVDQRERPAADKCVSSCSATQYLQDPFCRDCPIDCLSCTDERTCQQCQTPLVLSGGKCVTHCAQHEYIRTGKQPTCNDVGPCLRSNSLVRPYRSDYCSHGCAMCNHEFNCLACFDGLFLKDNSECVEDCGPDYYSNSQKRLCEENSFGPKIRVVNQVLINDTDEAGSLRDIIEVLDADTTDENLIIYLVEPPQNGNLIRIEYGKDVPLSTNDSFSIKDMRNNKVVYTPRLNKKAKDSFVLKASDRQLFSAEVVIEAATLSDDGIQLAKNEPLTALAGQDTPFNDNVLDFFSEVPPEDVTLTVLTGPLHGELFASHKSVKVFTLNQLRHGEVYYRHNGQYTTKDTFVLQAYDGYNVLNTIVDVHIRSKNSKTPILIRNKMGYVNNGEMLKISSDLLKAISGHHGNVKNLEIVYTLVPSHNNPQNGDLLMVVPSLHEKYGDEYSKDQTDAPLVRFLQRDIDEGRIWYKHRRGHNTFDFIDFEVSDSYVPPHVLNRQQFQISISGSADIRSSLSDGSKEISILENEWFPLDNKTFAINNATGNLLYTIISPIQDGDGFLRHIDRPFETVTLFNLQDLNNQKIQYKSPMVGSKEKKIIWKYTVTNKSNTEKNPVETELIIRILPAPRKGVKVRNARPLLNLAQGGWINLGSEVFSIFGSNCSTSDVIVKLLTQPQYGKIQFQKGGKMLKMLEGEKISYDDLCGNVFRYRHNGKSKSLEDSFEFSIIYEGFSDAKILITVHMIPVKKSSPYSLPESSQMLTIKEGESVKITKEVFGFKRTRSFPKYIKMLLLSVSRHGKLFNKKKELKKGDVFTQRQINLGNIRYQADEEIGTHRVTEILLFNVSDIDGIDILPYQALAVTVLPVDTQPPELKVFTPIRVPKSFQRILSIDNIKATDVDTENTALDVVIQYQPKNGNIKTASKNLKTVKTVTDFPYDILIDGRVIYDQNRYVSPETTEDYFTVYVTDGINQSPARNVTVLFSKDTSKESIVLVCEQIFVKEDHSVTLTNSSLSVIGAKYEPVEVIFKIDQPPLHGFLKKKQVYTDLPSEAETLKGNDHFTYEDILGSLVLYKNVNDEETTDSFTLNITYGAFFERVLISVGIGLLHDETPRVAINDVLHIQKGSTERITSSILKSTDVDTDDSKIIYKLIEVPAFGRLRLNQDGVLRDLTSHKPDNIFTQTDINKGLLEYSDDGAGEAEIVKFKFTVADPQGNELLDQYFCISIADSRSPPTVDTNEKLILSEGASGIITTRLLSASDANVNNILLNYTVTQQPEFGHLEFISEPGIPISMFRQSDLIDEKVKYVHTSPAEVHSDSFRFSVTDGQNEITEKFSIVLTPTDDSIPVVINNGLRVQKNTRKVITKFDLEAVDNDTRADRVTFYIAAPTQHGVLHLKNKGRRGYSLAYFFTMEDIYDNRLSYLHGSTYGYEDSFKFTVSDGRYFIFSTKKENGELSPPSTEPQTFDIHVQQSDYDGPILERNLGLQFLENTDDGVFGVISKNELKSTHSTTDDANLIYVVKTPPIYGRLQNKDNPESFVSSFTQDNINQEKILYILTGNGNIGEDWFVFEFKESQPNNMSYIFQISWTIISFKKYFFNISETERVVRIPLIRTGSLRRPSLVTCATSPGNATSMKLRSQQGTYDFVQHWKQIKFDKWENRKDCFIRINDDSVFEGKEMFYVKLRTTSDSIVGQPSKAIVEIHDLEDEPVIEFTQETFHVNETDIYLRASLKRKGDASQVVSVVCSTLSLTATGSNGVQVQPGSDFIELGENHRVVFPQDVTETTCPVKIIDDNLYEAAEHFQLVLSNPSPGVRLGPVTKAIATIDGPNDESLIFFSQPLYVFHENAGTVEVDVLRSGSEQLHTSIVWCATRLSSPLSAMPRQDYTPVSNRLVFRPGQTTQKCQLTILNDDASPKLEGKETFEIFLSSPVGSTLQQPFSAVVVITDLHEDVAVLQFENMEYRVDEKTSSISVPIVRSGDIGYESSAVCYTQQGTAISGLDYKERRHNRNSTITFQPGEMTKNCTVFIEDDANFEKNESFVLFLGLASGDRKFPTVSIGEKNNATIFITNSDDVPRVQFKHAAYSVSEPKADNQVNTVVVQVVRTGDIRRASRVRCVTRDASAESGLDYFEKSSILHFKPGMKNIEFAVDILYNREIEGHETFTIILEPEELFGAKLGKIRYTTVTILDNEISKRSVFPAPPLVVSLLYYDEVEKGLDINPSPGYPLVCVTPCDSNYPAYKTTRDFCRESGFNSSRISFRWEVAFPSHGEDNTYETFMELTEDTLFTKVTGSILDSIYFRSQFRLRCSITPINKQGNLGIRLNSNVVDIGESNGICRSLIYPGNPFSYEAQSFTATLKYTPVSDPEHPNTIQISVAIPHRDGLLPLISTMPLSNVKFLLSDAAYQQHHVCSNLITSAFVNPGSKKGFLNFNSEIDDLGSDFTFPHQYDEKLRTKPTVQLYRHLDLKSCTWIFRTWYHMADLVDQCGGKILTDLRLTDTDQSFLTIRVPLYVSYLYASTLVGWSSLEHHTEMQFSFYYQNVLWKAGREGEGQLQVLRIAIEEDGHLIIDFRTQAKFRGLYVLEDNSQPLMKSRLLPPYGMSISFDLVLLWSEQTYDAPKQLWRATSKSNRKDYTGLYIIELLPCVVNASQEYSIAHKPIRCTVHKTQRFQLPISFRQTNRPVPMRYSLNTRFLLTNKDEVFRNDPRSAENNGNPIEELDYDGAFYKGQKIFGRVLWNPDQDLSSAYKLSIKKVYLCTGNDGYIPTYDPTGKIYKEGRQFGCAHPNPNLKHRFLILDRDRTERFKIDIEDSKFGAKFIDDIPKYQSLKQLPGVDGFEMPVDPLYKINSGHQWFLQVLYVIGPSNGTVRIRRSAILASGGQSLLQNGTNMKMLTLDEEDLISQSTEIISTIVPGVALFLLFLVVIASIFIYRHFKRN